MKTLRAPFALLCSTAVQSIKGSDAKSEPVLVRRTDLPVYAEEIKNDSKDVEESNTFMKEAVKSFRVEACKVAQSAKSVKDRCNQFISTGVAHSYTSYENATEFLRDDKNLLPRMGAIGGGVIVGYVFGLRRGFFKRLLYTGAGGASVAAVCYPEEANEYFESSAALSKRYFIIGYYFVNGVTKDFIGFELPALPQKIQESVSDGDTKDK